MTPQEFDDLRQSYEAEAIEAAHRRHQAATAEIDRCQWVRDETQRAIDSGIAKTVAEKDVRASDKHRDWQRSIAKLTLEYEVMLATSNSTLLALSHLPGGNSQVVLSKKGVELLLARFPQDVLADEAALAVEGGR